jgi:dTDP-4-dehydrorhamnose reductase
MRRRENASHPLDIWAGIECTVNRVGDTYFDQLERNGHARRIDDLDRFAALGIRTMRYPILWERIAPDGLARADWTWADERLQRLRELGIRPIVGLVHHGSGPRGTNLLDPSFAEGLAAFAGAVAARYPWIADYTPVNEPLTTARFSALYGIWYPHAHGGESFSRALLNECRATILAMRAIRAINPTARLIQTEDLGKTFSTSRLAYQTEYENERRWLTYDLLCGQMGPGRRMWYDLRYNGISEDEIRWFAENACPPDILGINYYITSERFLDHALERYPERTHGGNGQDRYADVEAVRVRGRGIAGLRSRLGEAWQRYRLPIAVTEAHLGGEPEEQVRWLHEMWQEAHRASADGIDLRAFTVWALLGAYDWDSLVTRERGHYEPGVFDARTDPPQPTALAAMLRAMIAAESSDDPALAVPGWWRRPERLLYPRRW